MPKVVGVRCVFVWWLSQDVRDDVFSQLVLSAQCLSSSTSQFYKMTLYLHKISDGCCRRMFFSKKGKASKTQLLFSAFSGQNFLLVHKP